MVEGQKECPLHSGVTERQNALERQLEDHDRILEQLWSAVNEIRTKLLNRPQWWVTMVLSLLLATAVGLIVKMACGPIGGP